MIFRIVRIERMSIFLIVFGLACGSVKREKPVIVDEHLPKYATDTFYVTPSGNDSHAKAEDRAFRSLGKAIELVRPGETILVREGTYHLSNTIALNESGTGNKCINLWAYPGEVPILDFSETPEKSDGLKIKGNFWRIRELSLRKREITEFS